jgi:hypothetical protein
MVLQVTPEVLCRELALSLVEMNSSPTIERARVLRRDLQDALVGFERTLRITGKKERVSSPDLCVQERPQCLSRAGGGIAPVPLERICLGAARHRFDLSIRGDLAFHRRFPPT